MSVSASTLRSPYLLLAAALLLGALCGWGYLQITAADPPPAYAPRLAYVDHSARIADYDAPIVLLSLSTCRACASTRERLQTLGVRFAERSLDSSEAARAEAKALGARTVPLVLSRSAQLEGYDEALLDELLRQAGVL